MLVGKNKKTGKTNNFFFFNQPLNLVDINRISFLETAFTPKSTGRQN